LQLELLPFHPALRAPLNLSPVGMRGEFKANTRSPLLKNNIFRVAYSTKIVGINHSLKKLEIILILCYNIVNSILYL